MLGIQAFIGDYVLKSKSRATKKKAELLNIYQAERICVLVDLLSTKSHKELVHTEELLKQYVKEVDIITYSNSKMLPEEFTGSKYYFLDKRDLNIFRIPKQASITEFLKKKYDILLLFNPGHHLPLYYLSASINSRLKIGEQNHLKSQVIEFELNLKKQQLFHFIETVVSYLKKINQNNSL